MVCEFWVDSFAICALPCKVLPEYPQEVDCFSIYNTFLRQRSKHWDFISEFLLRDNLNLKLAVYFTPSKKTSEALALGDRHSVDVFRFTWYPCNKLIFSSNLGVDVCELSQRETA